MDKTNEAIDQMIERADEFAKTRDREIALEDGRPAVKQEAILRIIRTSENPLNGKPHSASSAETVVETDHAYMAYRVAQREAVVDTIRARAQYEAALFRCRALTASEMVGGGMNTERKTVTASLVRTAPEQPMIAQIYGTCFRTPSGSFQWTLRLKADGHSIVIEGSDGQKVSKVLESVLKAASIARDAFVAAETPNQRVA